MTVVDADGCSIHYVADGDATGPPVVFLGERGFGAWQWGWQYGRLPGRIRTAVVDFRGCGRSDAPTGSYTLADHVSDLEAVLSDADIRKAHLVGCGLGGCVALAAARQTNRVRSLTCIGTPPTGTDIDPTDLSADPADTSSLRESTEALLSASFRSDASDLIEQIVVWRADEDADPTTQAAQQAALNEFNPGPLYEITVPTRVISGENDSVVDPEASRQLAEDLPRGAFRLFGDAGHLVTIERAATLTDELVMFIESVDD